MNRLSDRIRESRKRLGLSQTEMALACGVTQPTITNWEKGGHIPRRDALERIADCLKVDPVWLLSGENSANQTVIKNYLNTPIYHIPIYPFAEDTKGFTDVIPLKFMSLSISYGDLFGLEAPTSNVDDGSITTFIFDRNIETSKHKAQYLAHSENGLAIIGGERLLKNVTNPIARLILTVKSH